MHDVKNLKGREMLRGLAKPIELAVTGEAHEDSEGTEVLWVGVLDRLTRNKTGVSEVFCEGDWHMLSEIDGGEDYGIFSAGFRGDAGKAKLRPRGECELVFVSHPWSGIVEIKIGDQVPFTADLFSPETRIVTVDSKGRVRPLDPRYIESASFSATTADSLAAQQPVSQAEPGILRIKPLGISSPQARDCEVIILDIQPFGLGISNDLERLSRLQGWDLMEDISLGGQSFTSPIRSTEKELVIQCDEAARLTLLKHAWSGLVEVSLHDTSVVIDLFSENDRVSEFSLKELRNLAKQSQTKSLRHSRTTTGVTTAAETAVSRADIYKALAADIDPHKPVAIFVPRWRGVALSTETLFEQSVPIPPTLVDHPDDITEEDVDFFARTLLETGSRHFVVSGGDTFNLKILDAMTEIDPQVRCDLLWHSNYLQMGEHHDWNLLRHWLQAAHEGKITRIGVVKGGMENWFRGIGLDAVYIPNIVPFDTEAVKATTVRDCVGLWLSGSTHYRKMPHAAIAAVSMMPEIYLSAAGLDPSAMKMISAARTRFRHLHSETLPREQLHQQMQETGLTLYVTLSECSPMLPLESFSLGVPCLVGPASNLFRDDEYLAEKLIVERPLSPTAIAEKAIDALDNQTELFERYKLHYADTLVQAEDGVRRLLA